MSRQIYDRICFPVGKAGFVVLSPHPVYPVADALYIRQYKVNKVIIFPVPSQDVTNQTLPWQGTIKLFPAR